MRRVPRNGCEGARGSASALDGAPTQRGIDSVVNQAIRGHGGMPARGGKAELNDNEVRNSIIYI